MKNKSNRFLKDLPLRVISLVIATVLWLLVNNINDPIKTWNVPNVPVKLQHTSLITDRGEVYSVLDNTDVVPTVTIRAHRSIIDSLQKDDIYAVADVENLTSLNTVEIQYYSAKYNNEIEEFDGSIKNVKLSIEKKQTKSFALSCVTSGTVAQGYELGTVVPEQNQVRVSGPESVVGSIARATATVDISGATASISTYQDIRLQDADGNDIDTSNLTMNITSVKVNVNILPVKTVPVTVEPSGDPEEGYLANGVVTVDPETVQIEGKSSVLEKIDSIVVPSEEADITGLTRSLQETVNIRDYLPEGTAFADSSFDGTVNITIGIEQAQDVTVEVSTDSISLNNVPAGFRAQILSVSDGGRTTGSSGDSAVFDLVFRGLSADIDSIKVSDLAPAADLQIAAQKGGSAAGTYTVPVTVTVPANVTLLNEVTANVRITEQNALSGDTEAGGTDED